MKKEDYYLLLLALLLLAAMIFTFLFGGQASKHGVSVLHQAEPGAITGLDKTNLLIYVKAGCCTIG